MRRPYLYVLDEAGEPLSVEDVQVWGQWFEGANQARRIARDDVGEVRVSTIFLGLDHNFIGFGEPVLWETMIFGGALDGAQRRYASKDAALRGHARHLRAVQRLARTKEPTT